MVRFGGDTSNVVGFCGVYIVCLKFVCNCFDRLCVGVECVLSRLPYEVGMVTPSECCVGVWSKGCVGSVGRITGVYFL